MYFTQETQPPARPPARTQHRHTVMRPDLSTELRAPTKLQVLPTNKVYHRWTFVIKQKKFGQKSHHTGFEPRTLRSGVRCFIHQATLACNITCLFYIYCNNTCHGICAHILFYTWKHDIAIIFNIIKVSFRFSAITIFCHILLPLGYAPLVWSNQGFTQN